MTRHAVLCVDDEDIVLRTLKDQLRRRFGDRLLIETAQGADEAWDVIADLHDDGIELVTIVSDWLMPGVRGDRFLADVHRRYPRIVKVLLTGQADDEAIERARRDADLTACLHKPWSEDEPAAVVGRAVCA
jgi:CheY-like chemotaxis protein